MISSTMPSSGQAQQDREVWSHLKEAIASSSGFKRWQAEKVVSEEPIEPIELEDEVYAYLKETLETLAY